MEKGYLAVSENSKLQAAISYLICSWPWNGDKMLTSLKIGGQGRGVTDNAVDPNLLLIANPIPIVLANNNNNNNNNITAKEIGDTKMLRIYRGL